LRVFIGGGGVCVRAHTHKPRTSTQTTFTQPPYSQNHKHNTQVVVAELTDPQDLRAVVSKGLEGIVALSEGALGGSSAVIDPGDVVALYLRCRELAEVGLFVFFWFFFFK
jgi:hypothetical protein